MVKEKFSGVFKTLVATLKQQSQTMQAKLKEQSSNTAQQENLKPRNQIEITGEIK